MDLYLPRGGQPEIRKALPLPRENCIFRKGVEGFATYGYKILFCEFACTLPVRNN